MSSHYAAAYMRSSGYHQPDEREGRVQSRFKLRWIDLVRPGCYWPQPYSLEQALLAFRFLVWSADPFVKYGRCGPIELLSKQPTCLNMSAVAPIHSLDDLRQRFHFALLYGLDCYGQWRKISRVGVNEIRWIPGKHYEPFAPPSRLFSCEGQFHDAFIGLLATKDVKLNHNPNEYHPRAVWIQSVWLDVTAAGFCVRTEYSYRHERSSWLITLAQTKNAEPPMDVIARACAKLKEITA